MQPSATRKQYATLEIRFRTFACLRAGIEDGNGNRLEDGWETEHHRVIGCVRVLNPG